jgi:hypothetical protein
VNTLIGLSALRGQLRLFSMSLSAHSKDLRGLKACTELLVGSTSQSRIGCATQEMESVLSVCARRGCSRCWRRPRAPTRPVRWILQDALANGRKLRTLSIEDAYTREMLAIEVDTSLPALRVVRVPDRRRGDCSHSNEVKHLCRDGCAFLVCAGCA